MLGPQVESEGAIQALQDFQQNVARQFMIRIVPGAHQSQSSNNITYRHNFAISQAAAPRYFPGKQKMIFEIQNQSFRGLSERSGLRPGRWRESPESITTSEGYGFRARAIQVGYCRLGSLILPNSGKPEFGRRAPE